MTLQAEPAAAIEDGFGETAKGEDVFDALIGLLGLIEAVCDPARCVAPPDPAVRDIEGWTLGTDPGKILSPPTTPRTARRRQTTEIPRNAATAVTQPDTSRERMCPACQQKKFARWPWGWDRHAAHGCSGVVGDTPEERKRIFRERYITGPVRHFRL